MNTIALLDELEVELRKSNDLVQGVAILLEQWAKEMQEIIEQLREVQNVR